MPLWRCGDDDGDGFGGSDVDGVGDGDGGGDVEADDDDGDGDGEATAFKRFQERSDANQDPPLTILLGEHARFAKSNTYHVTIVFFLPLKLM